MKLLADMNLWEWVKKRISSHSPTPVQPITNHLSTVLDLHGMTVQEAYLESRSFIQSRRQAGYCSCLIITGRSGDIARDFETWMDLNPNVRSCTVRNGGGAFQVTFCRSP